MLASVYVLTPDTEFVTRNAYNGDDTNIGPAGAFAAATIQIGDPVGAHITVAGVHGIDAGDTGLVITRFLDAQNVDPTISGNAVDKIVFRANV
jgi:hypothetical protein